MNIFNFLKQLTLTPFKFVLFFSLFNALVYNIPLYNFAVNNADLSSLSGVSILVSLFLVVLSVTAFVLSLICLVSTRVTKALSLFFVFGNSLALYFMLTYQVILDRTMMGNVFNSNFEEGSSYFSLSLLSYVLFLALIPGLLIYKTKVQKKGKLKLLLISTASLVVTVVWLLSVSSSWLWIDEHGKRLGGTVLPWSYVSNSIRYQQAISRKNQKQKKLPDGKLNNQDKQLVVLVIGETARASNFIEYGYERLTTPLLQNEDIVALQNTSACSTYTTASLRCILSHKDTSSEFAKAYEPLPSYLSRHGVDVIWRSSNWGEPRISVNTYERAKTLKKDCSRKDCKFDGVLLSGLSARIDASQQEKVFIVLHISGSHGPAYYEKYPQEMEQFTPVCKSVELQNCTPEELINAYDNSLIYTDFFLSETLQLLKQYTDRSTALLYISDHGESLGEEGLYLHGTPYSFAPDYQKKVPFFLWMSDSFKQEKGLHTTPYSQRNSHSQLNVFHSILGAFGMESAVYDAQLDLFTPLHQ